MPLGLSSGYGAKAGGDAFRQILQDKLAEVAQQEEIATRKEQLRLQQAGQAENVRQFDVTNARLSAPKPDELVEVEVPDPTDPTKAVRRFVKKDPNVVLPVWTPPKPTGTRAIDTMNTQGERVTRIVPDVPGGEYPNQPPTPPVSGGLVQTVDPKNPTRSVYTPTSQAAGMQVPQTPRTRPVSGADRKVLGFYTRMREAMDEMEATEPELSESDLVIIQKAPSWTDLFANRTLSPAGQRYAQSLKKYTEGRLRQESGAAISEGEYANDRAMVGRASGDQPGTVAQKRKTRETTAASIANTAGQAAFDDWYGEGAFEDFKRRLAEIEAAPSGNAAQTRPAGQPKTTYTVGQTVTIKGVPHKVTRVYPDGTFDAEPARVGGGG